MLLSFLQDLIGKQIQDLFGIKVRLDITAGPDDWDFCIRPGFVLHKSCQVQKSVHIQQQSDSDYTPYTISKLVADKLQATGYMQDIQAISGYVNFNLLDIPHDVQPDRNVTHSIIIDYASINPTGPAHVAHLRSGIASDTVANVLEFLGAEVARDYYVNDAGGQAERLAESVYESYRALFNLPRRETEYMGEYTIELAESLKQRYGDKYLLDEASTSGKSDTKSDIYRAHIREIRLYATSVLLERIKHDLALFGIKHTQYTHESALDIASILRQLPCEYKLLDAPIKHVLENPKPVLTYHDKALTKQDGTFTYLAGDIALHTKRYKQYDQIVDFFGADHAEISVSLLNIMRSIKPNIDMRVKTCQMVHFTQHGQEYKMSKRANKFLSIRQIYEEIGSVGAEIMRLNVLSKSLNSQLTLSVEDLLTIDPKSSYFYIQYAHARCYSVLNKATIIMSDSLVQDNTSVKQVAMSDYPKQIRGLLVTCHMFDKVLQHIVTDLDPYHLYHYTLDLAKQLHNCWNTDIRLSQYRNVITCVKYVLHTSLKLMGITAQDHIASSYTVH